MANVLENPRVLATPSVPRRWIAATALIGFPLLVIAANRFDHLHGDNAERVQAMATHGDSQAWQAVLMYASSLLLIAAVIAIGHLTIERTPKVTRVAMAGGVVGAAGHVVLATYGALAIQTGKGDRAEMVAYLDRVDDSLVIAPLGLGIMLYGPALLLLVIALHRARIVGRIPLGLMVVALAVHLAPSGVVPEVIDLPNLLAAAVFVPLGVRIGLGARR